VVRGLHNIPLARVPTRGRAEARARAPAAARPSRAAAPRGAINRRAWGRAPGSIAIQYVFVAKPS
jgi:hypothetical protein